MHRGILPRCNFMKKHLLTSILFSSLSLFGCSSVETQNLEPLTHFSGGNSAGDTSSLYWTTERFNRAISAADHVSMGAQGRYESDYRWEQGELRELIRKGEQADFHQDTLVPFQVHIRFNKDGDAVYQQYRVNNKVLPLQREQLEKYKSEANHVIALSKEQSRNGQHLIQGHWDGDVFETCSGDKLERLEVSQALPKVVIDRLSSIESYLAFIGKESRNQATVDELLLLHDENFDCLPRPKFISE
ncbi:DUF1481 domain-containing protein [Vibrio mytili]